MGVRYEKFCGLSSGVLLSGTHISRLARHLLAKLRNVGTVFVTECLIHVVSYLQDPDGLTNVSELCPMSSGWSYY